MGEANQARAVIESVAGDVARVRIGGLALDLPARGLAPGQVDVVIRPEAMQVAAEGQAAMPATVVRAIYMGSHAECRFETELGEMFVIAPRTASRLKPGDRVGLSLDPDGVVLVPG
jgi:iron(III) transport system ATP-binding protein